LGNDLGLLHPVVQRRGCVVVNLIYGWNQSPELRDFRRGQVLSGVNQTIENIFEQSQFLACSMLGYVEVAATIARKRKAGHLGQIEEGIIQQRLQLDWNDFLSNAADRGCTAEVWHALSFTLRGADAVHLASVCMCAETVRG